MSSLPSKAKARPDYRRGVGGAMDALIHGPTACGSSYLPGVLLCCVLGGFGLLLGSFVPGLGGVSSAILLGVLVGNLLHPSAVFRSGIQLCETRLL